MKTGVGKCRTRTPDGWVMFAVIHIEVLPSSVQGISIQFEPWIQEDEFTQQFVPAIGLGLRYAWGWTGKPGGPGGFEILVRDFEYQPVDTSQMSVVWAAALALWDAFQIEPKRAIAFEADPRRVSFPV